MRGQNQRLPRLRVRKSLSYLLSSHAETSRGTAQCGKSPPPRGCWGDAAVLRNPPSPGAGSALSRSRSREAAMPAVATESRELGHAAHSPPSTELSSCKDKQGEHCSGRCAGQNVCAGPGAANVLAGLE